MSAIIKNEKTKIGEPSTQKPTTTKGFDSMSHYQLWGCATLNAGKVAPTSNEIYPLANDVAEKLNRKYKSHEIREFYMEVHGEPHSDVDVDTDAETVPKTGVNGGERESKETVKISRSDIKELKKMVARNKWLNDLKGLTKEAVEIVGKDGRSNEDFKNLMGIVIEQLGKKHKND